jgi:hypothetical protein
VNIRQQTLYTLIDQEAAQSGKLETTTASPGLEAYAFTFGN